MANNHGITPANSREHEDLLRRVDDYLHGQGFFTGKMAYHDSLHPVVSNRLAQIDEPTALWLRNQADRLAVHQRLPCVFQDKAKPQHKGSAQHDLCLQGLPLVYHIFRADYLRVDCLYIYSDPYDTPPTEIGFWASWFNTGRIEPRQVIIYPRYQREMIDYRQELLATTFMPLAERGGIRIGGDSKGSGTEMVIVDRAVIHGLPGWRELVSEKLASANGSLS